MADTSLAILSNDLMAVAIVVYSLALLGYAVESAYGRPRPVRTHVERRERALVGAGAPVEEPVAEGSSGEAAAPPAEGGAGTRRASRAELFGRFAVALTALGWAVHLGEILTRGFAAHRLPWGNMYEFASALAFAAVTAYLVLLVRSRVRYLGLFVMIPVVLGLGLAATVLYTSAGPLVPALHSYWIAIHVTAAATASGAFTVGTVAVVLYLMVDRYERRVASGRSVASSGIAARLPSKDVLDRVAYRTIAFGFPVWTFAVIAGAIWAEAAWGRYWGWDPKETWSFITWVVYAGYLHARATAGWRGRNASFIALAGFACFLFNFFGVNIWIVGFHSYAGMG